MAYTKQTWTNGVSIADATTLGYIENGIEAAHDIADVTDAVLFYNGSSYPLRSTVTTSRTRRVRWVGPTQPTIESVADDGGAIDGLDVWEQTA